VVSVHSRKHLSDCVSSILISDTALKIVDSRAGGGLEFGTGDSRCVADVRYVVEVKVSGRARKVGPVGKGKRLAARTLDHVGVWQVPACLLGA